jgi:hypothetical protein
MEKAKRNSMENEKSEISRIRELLEKYGEAAPVYLLNEVNANKLTKDDYVAILEYGKGTKQGKWSNVEEFIEKTVTPNIIVINEEHTTEEATKTIKTEVVPEKKPIVSLPAKINVEQSIDQQIELRDDCNIATDFLKIPNNVFDLINRKDSEPLLEQTEFLVYLYLFKVSYGWRRNCCRIGHDALSKALDMSLKTVKCALQGLIQKHCIILIEEDTMTKYGSLYFICTPDDILSTRFKITRVNITRVKITLVDNTLLKTTLVNLSNYSSKNYSSKFDPSSEESSTNIEVEPTLVKTTLVDFTPNKDIRSKDHIKDSLSQDQVIDLFYNGIGQKKVARQKRERAENNIKELLSDGFTEEDIAFAVKWTLDNSKEKPYDFSLIKDTIGQATAAKKEIETKEAKRIEKERLKAQKEEEEKRTVEIQEKIKKYKENLNEGQRSELREKALEEIRKTKGIKEEFITNILIEAKENEIIRRQLGIEVPEE